MVDKNILPIFQIDFAKATNSGDFLPEYVSGVVKFEWDNVNKCFTDAPKAVVITAFFYALKKSKIDIFLPPDAMSEKRLAELNAKADADEDISLNFEGLKIGLKSGFGGEIQIIATADSVAIV